MTRGDFHAALSVRGLSASRIFCEARGFSAIGGDERSGFAVMENGAQPVGSCQGTFTGNILTINPDWDQSATKLAPRADMREIQLRLTEAGLWLGEGTATAQGPGSMRRRDPDANQILIEQHR